MRRPTEDPGVKRLPSTRVEWTRAEVARLDDDVLNRMREKMQTTEPLPIPPDGPKFERDSFIADIAMDCGAEFAQRRDFTPDEACVAYSATLGPHDEKRFDFDMELPKGTMKSVLAKTGTKSMAELGLLVLREALASRWYEIHKDCGADARKKAKR